VAPHPHWRCQVSVTRLCARGLDESFVAGASVGGAGRAALGEHDGHAVQVDNSWSLIKPASVSP
jgi:hypothetical protein